MDETIQCIELLAPFLSREQMIELCSGRKALAAWREAKMNLYRWRMARAYWEQRQIAQANAGREMRFVDGPGRHRLSVQPELHRAAELKYGEQIWKDPDFRSRVERDHPEMRVPCPSRRLHPVNGFKEKAESRNQASKPNQALFQLHQEGRL